EVPIEQHHCDARLAQGLGEATVRGFLFGNEFVWREENTADLPLDEVPAQIFSLLQARAGVLTRMGRTTPEQTVFVDARQAGQFAANAFEDFGVPQAGNEQPDLPGSSRSQIRRSGANVAARAGATL